MRVCDIHDELTRVRLHILLKVLTLMRIITKSRQLVDCKKEDGFAALHLAALNGHFQIVETLIIQGQADIDIQNNRKQTPLMLAVGQSHCSIIELLVRLGANVDIVNEDNDSGLHLALAKCREPLKADTVVTNSAVIPEILKKLSAIDFGQNINLSIACFLIQEGNADITLKNRRGKTALDMLEMPKQSDSQSNTNTPNYNVAKDFILSLVDRRKSRVKTPRGRAAVSVSTASDNVINVNQSDNDSTHTQAVNNSSENDINTSTTSECILCNDLLATVVFKPCGHLVVCDLCSIRIKRDKYLNVCVLKKLWSKKFAYICCESQNVIHCKHTQRGPSMAWTNYQIFLALLMVITGSINTLATKWADITKSMGKDGTYRHFNHPFVQAVAMFLGELTCLLAYKAMYFYYKQKDYTEDQYPTAIAGSRTFNPMIFLPPALCDMTATSLMYIGLNLTYASSFQMLRGALIIFTGLLSVAFLHRQLKPYEWLGILFVMCGLSIVGTSDLVFGSNDASSRGPNSVIAGDLLIIIAQIIAASQMVIEEKYVSGNNVSPLQAVGWEGLFGVIILSVLLVPMYFIPTGHLIFDNPDGQMEDAIDGYHQIKNSWQVAVALCGTIVSISFFNFAGISVTKAMSATTRTVLDSIRTFVIWIFSLVIGWEKLSKRTYVQVTGFAILMIGMFLYNNVLIRPFLIKRGFIRGEEPDASDIRPILRAEENETAVNPTMNDVRVS
ncbi:unnamed protein product [Medioppia subpectinata]|uniref:EamA domain-containing protein n=1 Tax=Medioppia subpectinata TaxID=1979941 RepID=A0A7R9KQ45_9ACAR|nr:unnamed protein product [Medioppia subpectinata]CAG2107460.1 unnamed protein product [Medioppia subpectinata]